MASRPSAPAKPGANSRGRGGKFKKYTRGGGKHYSRDLRPVDADGNEVSMWSQEAQQKAEGSDDEDGSDDEGDESEEDDEHGLASTSGAAADESRIARKEAKKARKAAAASRQSGAAVQVGDLPPSDSEPDDDLATNPNHSTTARSQTIDADSPAEDVAKLTIKEKAKAGEDREIDDTIRRADLERLAKIREERDRARQTKLAEDAEKKEHEDRKKAEIEEREARRRDQAMGSKKGKKK